MKKNLLLLLLSVICSLAYAQGIQADKVYSDGSRIIMGDVVDLKCFSDGVGIRVGLTASIDEGKTNYFLIVRPVSRTPFNVKEGMKLLLKDINGKVVTLESYDDYDASIGDIHHSNYDGSYYTDYSVGVFYEITEKTINQLSDGVLKIRLEINTGTIDKIFDIDKIGAVLKKEFALIKQASKRNKDFYLDF